MPVHEMEQIGRRIVGQDGFVLERSCANPILGLLSCPVRTQLLVLLGIESGGPQRLPPAFSKLLNGGFMQVRIMRFHISPVEWNFLFGQSLDSLNDFGPVPAANATDFLIIQSSCLNSSFP